MTDWTRRGVVSLAGAALAAEAGVLRPAQAQAAAGLTQLSLTEASVLIQNRKTSSVALTKALLERINTLNPKINAYITVMGAEALAQAAALDAELAAGKIRGPLHGIPIALKDNIDTAGTRTTAASPMFKNRVPTEDADIVRRLKVAGAVIIGKLNLHEFAMGCTGSISYFGPARNPWALDRVTGGSSSGSGGAVSAALAYGALGTDTGGSIRCPASFCGIVGLKPTTGLVSIRGIIPCEADLDHCGPMARTVEDVALMLGPMAGYDPLDIFSVQSTPVDYMAAMKQPVNGFRLSAPQSFYDHLEPDVEPVIMAALAQLVKLTAGITSRAPLWDGDPGDVPGDPAFYHHDLIAKYGMDYMGPTRAGVAEGETPPPGSKVLTAADNARGLQRLMTTRRLIDRVFKDFDLAVMPTTIMAAPKINDALEHELSEAAGAKPKKVYDFFTADSGCANTFPFDSYGIPAISVPCGFTKDGLPVGLMIAGPHFAEGKVLALAYAYQQSTGWHTRSPVLSADTPVPPIVEKADAEKEKEKKTSA